MNLPDYDNLNENQHKAVAWNTKPLLVLAGPGSGKTHVLTLRTARLLNENPDASVLALTFTTKAADEMRQRLEKFLGGKAERAHLCTFHSFARDLLCQHGSHVGIKPDFSLLISDTERIAFLKDVVEDVIESSPSDDETSIPADYRNIMLLLDYLFAESYNGEPEILGKTTLSWVPTLFIAYCKKLRDSNRLDFATLLYFARQLLRKNAGVARITQLTWQYICVDEFQDTNKSQYDLLKLLANGNNPNLFVVADANQTIYQWRGADPKRLDTLRSELNMEVIEFPENFRCPPEIIQIANNLIANRKDESGTREPMRAYKKDLCSNSLEIKNFNDEDKEAAYIPKLIKQNNWRHEDCVIIARTNKLLEQAANKLKEAGIEPFISQRKDEFESASNQWLYAILQLANKRLDRGFLSRICSAWEVFTEVFIKVEEVKVERVLNNNDDFLRAWLSIAYSKTTDTKYRKLLDKVSDTLVECLDFQDLLKWFMEQTWINDEIESGEIKTWEDLNTRILNEHKQINLNKYLQEMDIRSKASVKPPNSVCCFTVHGAKGMEFKHVFLIGMAEEVFPSYQAVQKERNSSGSEAIEEERRNCFVAITRAKETLNISYARQYNGYCKTPSRFLREMGLLK